MTDTNTTQDAATKAAEEIVSQTGDVPGISTKWLAGVIRRHFPQPVAPESGEFVGRTPDAWVFKTPETLASGDMSQHNYTIVSDGRVIAEVNFDEEYVDDPTFGEAYANGRLIAAAPTLLAERDARKAENDALRAEVARLREALESIVTADTPITEDFRGDCLRIARIALGDGSK